MLIQNVGAWVAAPIAAVFLLGVLWRRTTAAAATFVLLFAFPYTAFVEYYLFKHVSWLMPFDNWLNRTFLVWVTSMCCWWWCRCSRSRPTPEKIKGIIWSWKVAEAAGVASASATGASATCFCGGASSSSSWRALYAYMMWFQFAGPASRPQ